MELWGKMILPLRRVWISVSTRLGFRKTGLLLLRREVKACQYEDVHIMWEMLQKTKSKLVQPPARRKKRPFWNIIGWARFSPCLGQRF
ncbi:hypothetical protein Ancab_016494 [Ancistrocladus abbreviatus]